jgi:branched-subunit amino acid aminotransferase/4-amino-4-deoxychorismate lyase
MIRASIHGQEGKADLAILGLTAGSIERLTKGNAILFKGDSVNLPSTDFLIIYGDSPAEVIANMREMGFDLPEGDKVHIE